MRDAVVAVLLVAGLALAAFATLGVVLMREAIDRLHYAAGAAPATVCIVAAVLARDSFSLVGNKALLLAVLVLVTSPLVSHVTARAIFKERGR
jgi:multisubunit Na+/H+ antiporter MnhG subunit